MIGDHSIIAFPGINLQKALGAIKPYETNFQALVRFLHLLPPKKWFSEQLVLSFEKLSQWGRHHPQVENILYWSSPKYFGPELKNILSNRRKTWQAQNIFCMSYRLSDMNIVM